MGGGTKEKKCKAPWTQTPEVKKSGWASTKETGQLGGGGGERGESIKRKAGINRNNRIDHQLVQHYD